MGADRITTGPLGTAGTDAYDSPGAIVADQQNGLMQVVTSTRVLQTARSTQLLLGPQVALTAITTAQNLISKALNAGVLNVAGRWVTIKGWLIYSSTDSNVATITIAIKLGGVTLCTITTAATNTTASTNLPIKFEFDVFVPAGNKAGSTSALFAHGKVDANIGTAAAGSTTAYLDTGVSGADTITIGTNPTTNDTITVNGMLITFIVNGGTPVGNQVALGTTATLTATALYTFLAASTDANIVKATYTNPSNGVVLATAVAAGFVPWATTSVPAKITFSTPALDLTAAQTLLLTIAASAAVPSAQLQAATVEIAA